MARKNESPPIPVLVAFDTCKYYCWGNCNFGKLETDISDTGYSS